MKKKNNPLHNLQYGPMGETWKQAEKRWVKAYRKLPDFADYIEPFTPRTKTTEEDIVQAEALYFIPNSIKKMYRKAGNGFGNEFNGFGFYFEPLNRFMPLLDKLLVHWRDLPQPATQDVTDWYVNHLARFTKEEAVFINEYYRVFGCYWFRDEWPCYLFYGKTGKFGALIFNQDRWELNHLADKDFFLLRYDTVDELISRLVSAIINAEILKKHSIYHEEAYTLLDRARPGGSNEEDIDNYAPKISGSDIKAYTEDPILIDVKNHNQVSALCYGPKAETWQQAQQRLIDLIKTQYDKNIDPCLFVPLTETELNDLKKRDTLPKALIQLYGQHGNPLLLKEKDQITQPISLSFYPIAEIKPLFYRIAIDWLNISHPTEANMNELKVDGQSTLLDAETIAAINKNYSIFGSIKIANVPYYLIFDNEGKFGALYYRKSLFWRTQTFTHKPLQLTRYNTPDELISKLLTLLIHTEILSIWEIDDIEDMHELMDKVEW